MTDSPAETTTLGGAAVTRRGVVAATGLVGLGVLAGCGGASDTGAQDGGTKEGGAGGVRVATADVPVGGGAILKEEKVVVTQPKKNEFKAFSAVCTHRGCTVNKVADGTIDCPCHGSKFSVEDGSVTAGPAPRPLPSKTASVEGGEVVVG